MAENQLTALVRQLAQSGETDIAFADMDHLSPQIRRALGNPDLFKALSDNGFSTLNMEWSTDPVTKGFLTGTMSEEQFREYMSHPVMLHYQAAYPERHKDYMDALTAVFNADKSNPDITIKLPDSRLQSKMSLEMIERIKNIPLDELPYALRETAYQTEANCGLIQNQIFEQVYPPSEEDMETHNKLARFALGKKEGENADFSEADVNGSITAEVDEKTVKSIDQVNDKQAYIWGGVHTIGTTDLDDLVKAKTIALIEKPGSLIAASAFNTNMEKGLPADLPDYAYYITSDRVVKLDNDAARQEFLYGAAGRNQFMLSPEDERSCIAAIQTVLPHSQYLTKDMAPGLGVILGMGGTTKRYASEAEALKATKDEPIQTWGTPTELASPDPRLERKEAGTAPTRLFPVAQAEEGVNLKAPAATPAKPLPDEFKGIY